MDKEEVRVSFEKTEGHLIFCRVSFIPEDSQLADILEDDLDLLNVKVGPEIGKILFTKEEIIRSKLIWYYKLYLKRIIMITKLYA